MGKIRGTPCMWRHISAHSATTKYFSNSFVFKTRIEKEGLPGDSSAGLGAGGPRFKSARPDQIPELSELEEVDFGAATLWCNLGTIRKIPKLSAPQTCRKHMQTLNTERAFCVSGRRTVGTFRRANCS